MADFDGEEYYEMNFVPMKGLAFGVATINRDPPLPWQLLVADSYQKGSIDRDWRNETEPEALSQRLSTRRMIKMRRNCAKWAASSAGTRIAL